MAELQGFAAKAAYKEASTWGTAVAITAGFGDQFEYATEDVTPNVELIESDQITGEALPGQSDIGQITIEGSLSGMDLKYQGMERWIRDVFADYTVTNPGVTHFEHKFDFALSNAGFFGTLLFEKIVARHEYDSFKPMGLTFTGAPGEFVKLDVRGIGRRVYNDDVGQTNTTFDAELPSYDRILTRFGNVTVAIDPLSESPIVPNFFCVSGFTIDIQRTGDPVITTCDGDYASEPSTDEVEITGTLEFPIYDDQNQELVKAFLSKEPYTLLFTFDSGVVIPGSTPSQNYQWRIWIPAAQFTDPGWPNVTGRGRVPLTMNWTAFNSSVPRDTDATLPRIYVDNEVSDIDDFVP